MSGSSFVFYRFKSQREPSRIAFDGTAISVWDLKKEIIAENKMGKGADFDFAIYNADTEEGERLFYYLTLSSDVVGGGVSSQKGERWVTTRNIVVLSFFSVPIRSK